MNIFSVGTKTPHLLPRIPNPIPYMHRINHPPPRVLVLPTRWQHLAAGHRGPDAHRFFFLCWTGDYCKGGSDTRLATFRIYDVQFSLMPQFFCASNEPLSILSCATFADLTFEDQKNAVRGDSIGQGFSGHAHSCAVFHVIYWF